MTFANAKYTDIQIQYKRTNSKSIISLLDALAPGIFGKYKNRNALAVTTTKWQTRRTPNEEIVLEP